MVIRMNESLNPEIRQFQYNRIGAELANIEQPTANSQQPTALWINTRECEPAYPRIKIEPEVDADTASSECKV